MARSTVLSLFEYSSNLCTSQGAYTRDPDKRALYFQEGPFPDQIPCVTAHLNRLFNDSIKRSNTGPGQQMSQAWSVSLSFTQGYPEP